MVEEVMLFHVAFLATELMLGNTWALITLGMKNQMDFQPPSFYKAL